MIEKKSFDTKVKDRTPKETIKIISDFFENKKLKLIYNTYYREESLTWFVRVYLYYNDIVISASNGKGTSEDFAIASGLGEMYERYCNHMLTLGNPFLSKKVCQ
jgi:ribosomal protein S12 methylthiotransferase accessory factor YcaO